MSNTKIHIDQLFAKGLENLELPVFSSDFEKIKAEVTTTATNNSLFENFELPVTDKDWQGIKERLEKAPSRTVVLLPTDYAKDVFKDFEIAVTDADWTATKNKLEASSKKKMVWWWWLNMAILGLLLGALANYFTPLHSTTSLGQTNRTDLKNVMVSETPAIAPPTKNTSPDVLIPETTIETPLKANTNTSDPIVKQAKRVQQRANLKSRATKPEVVHLTTDYTSHSTTTTPSYSEPNEVTSPLNTIPNSDPIKTEMVIENTQKISIENILNNTEIKTAPKTLEGTLGAEKATEIIINNAAETITPPLALIDTSKKETPKTTTPPPTGPTQILPHFYVGLVTDIDRTYRHLSGNNSSAYNNIRNNADKAFMQFSYGFVAGMQKARNQFQIGAQMTSQNFTSNYNYVLKIADSLPVINGTTGQLIGKFPKPGSFRDTTISGSTQLVVKKVNIPFTYNRFWKLDGKTELMTGVNGILGITVKNSGDFMLNPANNQLYHFNYLKKAQNTLAFSPGLSLGIQRKIGTSFLLQTNVAAAYTVTNRYDKDFSAKQYPYSTKGSAFNAQEHLYSYGLSIKLLYLLH